VVLKRHRSLESDDAMKVARHVREGAVGKGLSSGYHLDFQAGRSSISTSLAVYFISACGKAAYMGKGNKECSYQMTHEEHVICDHPKKSLVCFVIEANEELP
jgi:hypothetical protein